MHRKVRGDHRQSASHRLHQRVSEGFSVGRRYVNVSADIKLMELTVRERSEFDEQSGTPSLLTKSAAFSGRYAPGFCRGSSRHVSKSLTVRGARLSRRSGSARIRVSKFL